MIKQLLILLTVVGVFSLVIYMINLKKIVSPINSEVLISPTKIKGENNKAVGGKGLSLEVNNQGNQDESSTTREQQEGGQRQKIDKTNVSLPKMMINQKMNYYVSLVTNKGEIIVDVFEDLVPITTNNFLYLANIGYYNQTIFHRVVKGFMIQGGCPLGSGTGGPGYKFNDELLEGEYNRGVVAMANSGPNTNGSQFFIMHNDQQLPNNYVIFGQVVQGIEVVDEIASAQTVDNGLGEKSKPVIPDRIVEVKIFEEEKQKQN